MGILFGEPYRIFGKRLRGIQKGVKGGLIWGRGASYSDAPRRVIRLQKRLGYALRVCKMEFRVCIEKGRAKTKCSFRVCKTSLGYAVERTFLASTEWVNALKGVYNGTFWTLKGGK